MVFISSGFLEGDNMDVAFTFLKHLFPSPYFFRLFLSLSDIFSYEVLPFTLSATPLDLCSL